MPGSTDVSHARVRVLNVPVDPLTVDQLHDQLAGFVRRGARATVLHANVHAVNLAHADAAVAALFTRADVVICDGYGVILGARLLGQRIPARITYADWMWDLAGFCEREGLSLYFLGAGAGIAARAAERLRSRHPRLRIAGTSHGYFDRTRDSAESLQIIQAINAARADLLLVGFGMPLQEHWVADHRDRIDVPVVLTAGAAFDYVSGHLRRPPAWMTRGGLEWLGRLAIEPRRLAGRYVKGNPLFLGRVLRERWRQRITGRPGR